MEMKFIKTISDGQHQEKKEITKQEFWDNIKGRIKIAIKKKDKMIIAEGDWDKAREYILETLRNDINDIKSLEFMRFDDLNQETDVWKEIEHPRNYLDIYEFP